MSKNILVIAEAKDGELRNVSFEAIALGKKLSEGGEVIATICGDGNLENYGEELIQYGADRVVTAVNPELKTYTPDGFTQAYKAVIDQENPDGIVMGHTSIGKDVTPKLASQLETGLISDVTEAEEGDDGFVFTRPIYSGKAFEKKIVTEGLTFVTIRPNNIASLEKDGSRSGDISSIDVDVQNIRTIIKEVIRKTSEGVDLSEAKVIVAGGRAVKSSEGFEPLQELADELGGAVGASRAACDAGYCDYSLQIGQTGKVVTPDLYIACGISGAIQHLAGMSNSKVIVAINKDPEATIFNIADYGLVGDIFEIVPKLTEEIRNMKVNS
ncbi:electron transfer flavoprotein subunit alpha/FixB family protein [Salimicrobium flavidum]|uniref:Electron transfer flavoprotein alpha subunit apoprotein n=1 Tax=Salimicrobium flavidum TaxID=570947 RepID=A0A1N7JPH5_9BACI|nr:electron transfer flavoprotein subunit alpha/FixB family protein [Salimicrobium flavidum]SIS51146.1 electron transfer flavoprotein alpha subunit apoprotein [Salimicrobium flavidum]